MRNRIAIVVALMVVAGFVRAEKPEVEPEAPLEVQPKRVGSEKADPEKADPEKAEPADPKEQLKKQLHKIKKFKANEDGQLEEVDPEEQARLEELKKVEPLADWSELSREDRIKELSLLYETWWKKYRGEWFEEAELLRKNKVGRYVERELDFIKKLTGSESRKERELAYNLLPLVVKDASEDVIDFLLVKMDDPPTQAEGLLAAKAAAWAARIAQSPAVMEDALDRFESPEIEQRQLALRAMGELQDPTAVDPLIDRLESGKAPLKERIWIYFAFSDIGSSSPQLLDYLEQRLGGAEGMLEKIAIEDTIFRLGQKPDLYRIASNMGRLEDALKSRNIGEGTIEGQRIVSESLQDLIDDIIDEASRKQGQKKNKKKKQGKQGQGQGQKSKAGQQQGGQGAKQMKKSQSPGAYDAEGMNEDGAKELLEKYVPERVDQWGNLTQDEKQVLMDLLKNPNVPSKYRTLLDSYFEAIARRNRENDD